MSVTKWATWVWSNPAPSRVACWLRRCATRALSIKQVESEGLLACQTKVKEGSHQKIALKHSMQRLLKVRSSASAQDQTRSQQSLGRLRGWRAQVKPAGVSSSD